MTDICAVIAERTFISGPCRLDPFHQCSCGNSAGELSTFERWLFGKTTCEEAPTAKTTQISAICVGACALELVWWSCCVQWRIQIFAVSSRWSCLSAQTSPRHGFPRRWECAAHGLACYVTGFEPDREPLVGNLTWIEQHGQPPNKTWLNCLRLLWTAGEIFRIRSTQPSFWGCHDTGMPYTTPEEATRSIEYFFHIAWHDSSALTQGQIFWMWISVVLWSFMSTNKSIVLLVFVTGSKNWQ